jgi:hypothetical protein
MKLFVKVKTKSADPGVEKISESEFIVRVKELPVKGKANEAVEKAIAEYLGIASWRVKIVSGATSKNKILSVV